MKTDASAQPTLYTNGKHRESHNIIRFSPHKLLALTPKDTNFWKRFTKFIFPTQQYHILNDLIFYARFFIYI